MNKINLSIVIPGYNAIKYIDACIESIINSGAVNYEIIVVDNGSDDGTSELKIKYPNIKYVGLDKNYGPAKARNEGVKVSAGRYLCFLDSDTIVHPKWSLEALTEFENDSKLGIVQCKLLLAKERNKIDYVGEYIGQNGFLVQRASAGEVDKGQYDQKVEILAAKSAGMFMRKKVFEEIGGFDDDYFIYVEETDLGWRSWLKGYTAKFIPSSIVYHEFGTSSVILGREKNNYNAKFHGCKNYILTLFKNLNSANLIKILPLHIFLWLGLAFFSLIKGQYKSFYWILKGITWNVLNIRSSFKKRSSVQKSRKISDEILFKKLMEKRSFFYFVNKATNKQKIGNAESFSKIGRKR